MIRETDYRSYEDFHVSIIGFLEKEMDHVKLNTEMKEVEQLTIKKTTKIQKKQYEKVAYKLEDAVNARLA